jgi:hypothetical protein
MTKKLSKKNYTILSNALDKIFINILEDMSIRYKINKDDLEKYYPENKKKKINKKENKKE